jgi:hypothetical protein
MPQKIIIHSEYDLKGDKELAVLVKEMHQFSTEELRLWVIQELANFGQERWPVIEIGVQLLRKRQPATLQ